MHNYVQIFYNREKAHLDFKTINDMKIKNIKQVVKIVASLEVNQKITVKHLRNESTLKTTINVAQMPESHKTINR